MFEQSKSSHAWRTPALIVGGLLFIGLLGYASYRIYENYKETKAAAERLARQNKVAGDALKSLNKMKAGTEVGINKTEYSRILIESKAAVNEASAVLPDDELEGQLNSAVESYADAAALWDIGGTDKSVLACAQGNPPRTTFAKPGSADALAEGMADLVEKMCNPQATALAAKYEIPKSVVFNDISFLGFHKDAGLNLIWKKAKVHIDRASVLVNNNQ